MTSESRPALAEIAAPLRAAIENLREGVQVIGRDWTYLYLNPRAAEHGQQPADRLLGRTLMACYPGIDTTPLFARLQRVMDTGHAETFRSEFVYSDDHRRWFDLIVEPVPDGICIISLDVTDGHQMEADLRESQARTEFALRAAQMGIWQLTVATDVLHWSDTMDAIAGFEPGTGPKTRAAFFERVDPQDRANVRQVVERALSGTTENFAVQFRWTRPDGQLRWIESHSRVSRDAAGVPDVLTGVWIDITARRNVELQLQQAQKMEAVGRLAGGIAHDFNNQLTIILGFCDLALAAADPSSALAGDLHEVRTAGQRAATLTRQLLAFSRRQVLTIEPLDLNALVTNVDRMLRRVLGEHISCELRLDPFVPHIRGDAAQLDSVLTNLAVNAADAMPSGGRLTVRTSVADLTEADVRHHPSMAAGQYTVLTVTDTGHGMDEATRARIFEPFFTTKDGSRGTGLGLSTVYGIIQQMSGGIEVDSEPGRGTSFRLFFPTTAEAPRTEIPRTATPAPVTRAATILVVEDEVGVRQFAVRALRDQGYTVMEARSAEEAGDVLERRGHAIDLVLLDVMLPGKTGPQLVAELTRPTRVLFMSGYSEQHVHDRGLPADVGLLEKPFTIEALTRRVRDALVAAPAAGV